MQYVNGNDIAEVMEGYDESKIDPEFLPYIHRINRLECAVTCQCCIGHIPYNDSTATDSSETKPPQFGTNVTPENQPTRPTDKWGYLALYVTEEMLEALAERYNHLKSEDWFWDYGSKVWHDFNVKNPKYELFSVTPNESAHIVFAWDAKHWPNPAVDITNALEICTRYLEAISK